MHRSARFGHPPVPLHDHQEQVQANRSSREEEVQLVHEEAYGSPRSQITSRVTVFKKASLHPWGDAFYISPACLPPPPPRSLPASFAAKSPARKFSRTIVSSRFSIFVPSHPATRLSSPRTKPTNCSS